MENFSDPPTIPQPRHLNTDGLEVMFERENRKNITTPELRVERGTAGWGGEHAKSYLIHPRKTDLKTLIPLRRDVLLDMPT